jgi:glycosyltransferase involved in cell wall biosynthesis
MGRIAILTAEYEPFKGGIATFVRELARGGAQLGHEVTVFAPDYLAECNASSSTGVTVRRYHAGAYSGRWYPAYLKAASMASRGGYDQVLAADIAFLESLALVFGASGQPFDAFVHGSEIKRSRISVKGRILAPLKIFRRPRRIFANSEFTRSLLLENFPYVDPLRAIVAPLGVGAQWFESADPNAIRNRLGLSNERIIACVGRITPRKGQLTLLQALATAELDRPNLCVVIAGHSSRQDSDFASQLKTAAANLKHAKAVFADDLSDQEVRSLYAAADIFCLPGSAKTSAVEGFGLVYLEAAAQGIPSVAGAVGGVPEVVYQGETGLLVRADDPVELGRAVALLLDDQPRRISMGVTARSRAQEFTWQRCVEIVFGSPAKIPTGK